MTAGTSSMNSERSDHAPSDDARAPRIAILVVGPHRCGTSALTRVINLLGAELPGNLLPPIENNTRLGVWESRDLMELHDENRRKGLADLSDEDLEFEFQAGLERMVRNKPELAIEALRKNGWSVVCASRKSTALRVQ